MVPVAVAPVNGLAIVMQVRLVVLDGRHDILRNAFVERDPRRFLLAVLRIKRDRAPRRVELSGVFASRGDIVGLFWHLCPFASYVTAVFNSCDRHPSLTLDLLRGSPDVLAVHGHRSAVTDVACPVAQGFIERIVLRVRKGVAEDRCCRCQRLRREPQKAPTSSFCSSSRRHANAAKAETPRYLAMRATTAMVR